MKKIICLILSLVMIFGIGLAFTGCQKSNTLVVATNAAFAPFEYKDASGKFIGIDMELIEALCKEMGMNYEIKDMDFDAVVTSIQSGVADLGVAALTVNAKRLESVDFSDSYYSASQMVIAKKSDAEADAVKSEAELIALLANKKIGFQSGTTAEFYVKGDADLEFPGVQGATPVNYSNGATAIIGLTTGSIDYIIIDEAPAKEFVKKNSDSVKLLNFKLTTEEYAIALPKGNTELKDKINKALKTLKEDGTLDKIVKKYIVEEQG